MKSRMILPLVLAAVALPATVRGQGPVAVELRGGANVPTFGITDAAQTGASFGAGVAVQVAPRLHLLAEGDFGFHRGAEVGSGGRTADVDVMHFMGKVGYDVLRDEGSPWSIMVNAGAGALTFAVEDGGTYTYPAINVGAKIAYRLTDRLSFVLSPQGDIAFSEAAEVGTSNAWVWPFAAGIRVRL